jgi:hypothetical protein
MARYDLMHWSQRVRDQQAAARAAQPPPSVLPMPVRQPAKPRASRPKPPRDEEAEQLLRLCREGRLFELQALVAAGKSLSVPAHYRQTPMRIALNTGFHSLIEFLLRHEENQSAKDDVLRQACWSGQRSVMQLALNHGASIGGVSFQSVIETWDRGVAQLFLEHGADPVTNAPFGKSLAALGFLLEKGARWTPDDRAIADTRRALYRVDGEGVAAVVTLLRAHHACDDNILTALVRTEKMRNMLAEANRQRAGAERHAKRMTGRETLRPEFPSPAKPAPARLPPSRYDRQRLYGEVWSEPTQQVAKRYGVSDVAIAKACALLAIPKPPRGYWAKKAAGHKLPDRPPRPILRGG